MVSRETGKAGWLVIGEVVNRKDDPWQRGNAKVKWRTGAIAQDQMSEEDLPWSQTMFPSTNPSLGHAGGPHTGYKEGSKVVGIPIGSDGQDILILGSLASSGPSSPDGQATPKSDIPYPALSDSNGGISQGTSGDINGIVAQESIVKYGQDTGGTQNAAKYASLPEPIGTLDQNLGGDAASDNSGDNAGSSGPMSGADGGTAGAVTPAQSDESAPVA